MSKKIHSIRKSQLIFNSGPGAIVDLSDFSGIVTGLECWDLDKVERMERRTRRGFTYLFKPPTIRSGYGGIPNYPHGVVPIKRFPTWVQCSNPECNIFGQFWHVKSQRNEFKCQRCDNKLVPARLIRICKHGHISDFPWHQFYHDGGDICSFVEPKYRLVVSEQQSGSLNDLRLFCECNRHPEGKNLVEVYSFPAGKVCGRRNQPWIDDGDGPCTVPAIVVLRGASNVYFPMVLSELTIPSSESKYDKFFAQEFSREIHTLRGLTNLKIRHEVIHDLLKPEIVTQFGIEKEQLVLKIEEYLNDDSGSSIFKDEESIRREEFDVLSNPTIVTEDIVPKLFSANVVEVDSILQRAGIDKIVAISRLQEIRVLRGFLRADPKDGKMVDIGESVGGRYPAVEVNGEGLFISFNESQLNKWEKKTECHREM